MIIFLRRLVHLVRRAYTAVSRLVLHSNLSIGAKMEGSHSMPYVHTVRTQPGTHGTQENDINERHRGTQ